MNNNTNKNNSSLNILLLAIALGITFFMGKIVIELINQGQASFHATDGTMIFFPFAFIEALLPIFVILITWIFVFVTIARGSASTSQEDDNIDKNGKHLKLVLIMLVLFTISIFYDGIVDFFDKHFSKKENGLAYYVDKVVDSSNSASFFIYKDKMYFYNESEGDPFIGEFSVVDLDGNNKKLLTTSEHLINPIFYLAYNGEVYFHNYRDSLSWVINLETGELSATDIDYEILPYTYRDGVVYGQQEQFINKKTIAFKKYDLKNKQSVTLTENVERIAYFEHGYFDYEKENVFYMSYIGSINGNYKFDLYEKDGLLHEMLLNDICNNKSSKALSYSNNDLYFYCENKLHKYSLINNSLTGNINLGASYKNKLNSIGEKNLYLVSDDTSDNSILIVDQENMTTKALSIPSEMTKLNTLVIEKDNILYILENSDDGYSKDIFNVYNIKNDDLETIKNVRKVSIDYESRIVNVLVMDNKTYKVQKYEY